MDLMPTSEQEQLLSWARSVLEAQLPLSRLAAPPEQRAAADPALSVLAELGWIGLALPERWGGSGLSVVEEMILTRESGRYLPTPSLLATQLSAHIAAAEEDEALTRGLIALQARSAMAIPSRPGAGLPEPGLPLYLLDGEKADHILVFTPTAIALAPREQFHTDAQLGSLDESVRLTSGWLSAGEPIRSFPKGSLLWLRGQVLVAAMLVGMAEASLEMALGYAKSRQQFGRPIGSFQAIKHKCADIAVQISAARSQTTYATLALAQGAPAAFEVLAARTLASRAAIASASTNIQIHGGTGFHVECNAHRYLKRANVVGLFGGADKFHIEQLLAGPGAQLPLEST